MISDNLIHIYVNKITDAATDISNGLENVAKALAGIANKRCATCQGHGSEGGVPGVTEGRVCRACKGRGY